MCVCVSDISTYILDYTSYMHKHINIHSRLHTFSIICCTCTDLSTYILDYTFLHAQVSKIKNVCWYVWYTHTHMLACACMSADMFTKGNFIILLIDRAFNEVSCSRMYLCLSNLSSQKLNCLINELSLNIILDSFNNWVECTYIKL